MPKPNPKSETLYVFSTQIVLKSNEFMRILTNDNFTVRKQKKSTTAYQACCWYRCFDIEEEIEIIFPHLFHLGWSVLLSRKALKRASKELKELCPWKSEVPCILSACLTSIEPDSHLRLMSDQYTPDERFGQTASNCQLSTPKDATCTHILVFPTSAKAQVCIEGLHWDRFY